MSPWCVHPITLYASLSSPLNVLTFTSFLPPPTWTPPPRPLTRFLLSSLDLLPGRTWEAGRRVRTPAHVLPARRGPRASRCTCSNVGLMPPACIIASPKTWPCGNHTNISNHKVGNQSRNGKTRRKRRCRQRTWEVWFVLLTAGFFYPRFDRRMGRRTSSVADPSTFPLVLSSDNLSPTVVRFTSDGQTFIIVENIYQPSDAHRTD